VVAYRTLGLLPEGSGYAETLREFGFADDCVVLVAVGEAGSGILGTITLEPFGPANELAQDETEADVRAFAVAPQAQGQGVGRKLLLALIACAGKRGVCRLRLCTRSAMKAAQHLYTGTGFSRTPDLDFEPVPGIPLRAYELALPPSPFPGRQPDKQPVWLSLALWRQIALAGQPGSPGWLATQCRDGWDLWCCRGATGAARTGPGYLTGALAFQGAAHGAELDLRLGELRTGIRTRDDAAAGEQAGGAAGKLRAA
jgi:GNAT superfamily N-acetyltransferase